MTGLAVDLRVLRIDQHDRAGEAAFAQVAGEHDAQPIDGSSLAPISATDPGLNRWLRFRTVIALSAAAPL